MDYNFKEYPILESERLILKRILKEHANELYLIRSDPDSMSYVPRPLAKSIEDAYELIENSDKLTESKDLFNFGIFLKEKPNILIGMIGYVRMNKASYRGEIGYMIHSIHHRKGYASEALKLCIDFGFKELKFHTIEAHIEPTNEPSIKLIQKIGFNLEAQFKENFFNQIDKKFNDTNVYCKINPHGY